MLFHAILTTKTKQPTAIFLVKSNYKKLPFPQVYWNILTAKIFQKTLYDAYQKLTKKIDVDLEEYNKMKEAYL